MVERPVPHASGHRDGSLRAVFQQFAGNADGVNSDYPDVSGYKIATSRYAELQSRSPQLAGGVFNALTIAAPGTLGTEGNELTNRFWNPRYANTDFSLLKNTHIHENANLQLRLEVFNLFNRPNLGGISEHDQRKFWQVDVAIQCAFPADWRALRVLAKVMA